MQEVDARLPPSRLFRTGCAFLTALILGGGLAWSLAFGGSRFQTRPVVHTLNNADLQLAATLAAVDVGDGVVEHRTTLYPVAPIDFARCHSLKLPVEVYREKPDLFGTPSANLPILDAEIRDDTGSLVFQPAPGARLIDNGMLEFVRTTNADANPHPVRLSVRIRVRDPRHVALWCRATLNGAGDAIALLRMDPGPFVPPGPPRVFCPSAALTFDLDSAPASRFQLLAFVWDLPGGGRTLAFLLACAVLCAAAGAYFLTGPVALAPTGIGAALAFFGVGVGYLVCIPPFQGPDEPVHALSYAGYTSDPELTRDSLRWARLGHFERIKFRSQERFTAPDCQAPLTNGWAEHINTNPLDMKPRSAATCRLWDVVQWVAPRGRAPGAFLTLRLADLVVAAIGAGVAGMLLAGAASRGAPGATAAIPLLSVPSLPFFSMIVSNYCVLIAAGMVLGAAVAAMMADRRAVPGRAAAFGFALGIALMSSRSALPLAGFAFVWLAAWVFRPTVEARLGNAPDSSSSRFWLSLGVSATLPLLLATPEFRAELSHNLSGAAASAAPMIFWLAIPMAALAGAFADALGRRLATPKGARRLSAAAPLLYAPAALLAASVVLFAFLPIPTVGEIEDGSSLMSRAAYVGRTLAALGASFGIGKHDFLMSTSFWVGFGWLDAIPPGWVVSLVCAPFATGLVLVWWTAAKRHDGVGLVLHVGWAVGLILYLAGLAAASFSAGINLHGRYLIVFYLLILPVAASGWAGPIRRWSQNRARCAAAFMAGPIILHTACLHFVLARYF